MRNPFRPRWVVRTYDLRTDHLEMVGVRRFRALWAAKWFALRTNVDGNLCAHVTTVTGKELGA